jgi:hypothetical protein
MFSHAENRRRSQRVTFAPTVESNQIELENENENANATQTNATEHQNRELIFDDTTNTCELEMSTELTDRFQVYERIPFGLVQKVYKDRYLNREKFSFRIHIDERQNKWDMNGSLSFLSIKLEEYVAPSENFSSSSHTDPSQNNVYEDIEEDYQDPDNDGLGNNQNNFGTQNVFENEPNNLNMEAAEIGLAQGNILIEDESSDEGIELPTLYQEQNEMN